MRSTKDKEDNDTFLNSNSDSGLILCGTVSQRTKRTVPVNNSTIEIVTYLIVDSNGRFYYVDDYAPDHYHEVGQPIHVAVYVKPYRKKNGDPSYSLNFLKPFHPSNKGTLF